MLEWIEYIPPTPSDLLDKKSMLRIVVKSAVFLRDADLIGKQDPYITFKYEDKTLKTDVKDGAGLNATWNETFQLPNIKNQAAKGGNIIFEAYDKDLVSSDLLGVCDPLDFEDYVEDDRVHEFDLELFDDKG
jgi:Ca2+-dependent lipid-binding protein